MCINSVLVTSLALEKRECKIPCGNKDKEEGVWPKRPVDVKWRTCEYVNGPFRYIVNSQRGAAKMTFDHRKCGWVVYCNNYCFCRELNINPFTTTRWFSGKVKRGP